MSQQQSYEGPDFRVEAAAGLLTTRKQTIFAGVMLLISITAALMLLLFPAMPTWLQLAIQIGLLFALGSLILLFAAQWVRSLAREAREIWDPNRESYAFNSVLYGFGYELLEIDGSVHHDGSMSIRRHTVVKAFSSQVSGIDQWLLAPEAPEGGEVRVGVVEPEPTFVEVRERIVKQTRDRVFLVLDIDPPITAGQELEYSLVEKVPPDSMALTRDELVSRKMAYEFIAWDITRPTKSFSLSVAFPEHLAPIEIEHDVWYGVSRMKNLVERDRVAPYWSERKTEVGREYSFEIPYPVLGLTYVVRWIPPDSIKTPDDREMDNIAKAATD